MSRSALLRDEITMYYNFVVARHATTAYQRLQGDVDEAMLTISDSLTRITQGPGEEDRLQELLESVKDVYNVLIKYDDSVQELERQVQEWYNEVLNMQDRPEFGKFQSELVPRMRQIEDVWTRLQSRQGQGQAQHAQHAEYWTDSEALQALLHDVKRIYLKLKTEEEHMIQRSGANDSTVNRFRVAGVHRTGAPASLSLCDTCYERRQLGGTSRACRERMRGQ
eukprot:1394280-Rhodomonas_salina.1